MRVACLQLKGGAGKSTLTVEMATYLAFRGRKVLVVDLDANVSASKMLRVDVFDEEENRKTKEVIQIDRVLGGWDAAEDAVVRSEWGVDVLVGCAGIRDMEAQLDVTMRNQDEKNEIFAIRLGSLLDKYDDVFFDNEKGVSMFAANAVAEADVVVIPVLDGASTTDAWKTYEFVDGVTPCRFVYFQYRPEHKRWKREVPELFRARGLEDLVIGKIWQYESAKWVEQEGPLVLRPKATGQLAATGYKELAEDLLEMCGERIGE